MSGIWLNLITPVLSCLLAGGITGIISVRIIKRQKRAEAAQAEASAKQIENQNELQDIVILNEKISAFDKIIFNLNNKLVTYIGENQVLSIKLDKLAAENKQLKADMRNMSKEYDKIKNKYAELEKISKEYESKYAEITQKYHDLYKEYQQITKT